MERVTGKGTAAREKGCAPGVGALKQKRKRTNKIEKNVVLNERYSYTKSKLKAR